MIEEASITGSLLVHDDIHLVQLDRSPEDLDKYTIPAFNDQLTNAWIHGGQAMWNQDLTPWTCHEIFQLGFSVFHLMMNLIWSLLQVHHGTINQYSSLLHFFAVLEKVWLGTEHPEFHTLLAVLTQIIDGLILNAWQDVCGFSSMQPQQRTWSWVRSPPNLGGLHLNLWQVHPQVNLKALGLTLLTMNLPTNHQVVLSSTSHTKISFD